MSEMEGDGICPACGYDNTQPNPEQYLQPGTIVASRYAVGALRSKNSEGAAYIGYDGEKDCPVWIREYFPIAIATRSRSDGTITPLPGMGAQYKALMSEFVDICNAVKRLSVSDSVIPIENVVAHNNTLYAIYKVVKVIPLEEYLGRVGGTIPVKKAIRLFAPLCETVSNMHARDDIHRGISPQTVYVDRSETLYLWDFALAATRTGGSELAAELFDGYAAPEQYTSNGWQGPWTDVYAMAALFYRCVSGINPPRSTMIGTQRSVTPLADLLEDISPALSDAVADAMGSAAGNRTQTMASFASKLTAPDDAYSTASTAVYDLGKLTARTSPAPSSPPPARRAQLDRMSTDSRTSRARRLDGDAGDPVRERRNKESEEVSVKYVALALLCTVLILVGIIWFVTTTYFPDMIPSDSPGREPDISVSEPVELSEPEESQPDESQPADTTVPSFVGMLREEVEANEDWNKRFTIEYNEEYTDTYAAGIIYDQNPSQGATVEDRGVVRLSVSKGKLMLEMPDIKDMTEEEIREVFAKLSEEHDVVLNYSIMERYDANTEPGKIISSIPAVGEEFDPKSTPIFIYISLKPDISEAVESSSSASSSRPGRPSSSDSSDPFPERDR
ncbi:PASTA domain-containing protein [Ruminococcaceae bacterium OttesenSCG-928-L11]|nr:PASTA domain-containing protein [Ruminococcaceae bacterium OttesenSCG-928-L11]